MDWRQLCLLEAEYKQESDVRSGGNNDATVL